MKYLAKAAFAVLGVLLWCTSTDAQTVFIGPNQYAFQYTVNPNFGLFFNSTSGRYEFRNGAAAPVFAFNANNGAMTTNLSFSSGSDLLIGNNRYAFRSASNPNYGLFFNGTSLEYQFLNNAASAVFAINANTGNMRINGGLRVGNSSLTQAGNIRWTGADFQGYDGSAWTSLTTGIPGPPGPPGLLPAGTLNAVPYYDGTSWDVTNTGMTNDGTSVGIGGTPLNDRLYVNALTSGAVAGASSIEGYRNGLVGSIGTLTSWSSGSCDAAVRGTVNWGNAYSAAVYGSSVLDYTNSASVVGSNSSGTIFGGLAYRTANGVKAGYFQGNVEGTGDLDLGGNANVAGDASVGADLSVSGVTVLDNTLNVAERITVQNSATDSIGIDLDGSANYFQSDDWAFGESNGVGPAISGDFIMSRFGSQEYIFWSSYLSPVEDVSKSLGRSSARWSTVYASNGTINTSDAREKKNIKELDYGLETLMKLKPVSYEWINDAANMGTKLGFVAQDLLEVVPEVVVTEEAVEANFAMHVTD